VGEGTQGKDSGRMEDESGGGLKGKLWAGWKIKVGGGIQGKDTGAEWKRKVGGGI